MGNFRIKKVAKLWQIPAAQLMENVFPVDSTPQPSNQIFHPQSSTKGWRGIFRHGRGVRGAIIGASVAICWALCKRASRLICSISWPIECQRLEVH
jgi:hypothetical protein